MSISYLPRCEIELIRRLLRGQGNVCLRSGACSGGTIGDNKSCECLRAQNVFAHKREFVAFQETLRANTSVPANPRIFLPECHNAHDPLRFVLCCCFFLVSDHIWEHDKNRSDFTSLMLAKMYTQYILNIF